MGSKLRSKENKWAQFEDPKNYVVLNLGRPARFLIPAKKLRKRMRNGTVGKELRVWLAATFGAYTRTLGQTFGLWKDGKRLVYDKCVEYKVSFDGKQRIPLLLRKLAEIAEEVGEAFIYLEAGQYAGIVGPPKSGK